MKRNGRTAPPSPPRRLRSASHLNRPRASRGSAGDHAPATHLGVCSLVDASGKCVNMLLGNNRLVFDASSILEREDVQHPDRDPALTTLRRAGSASDRRFRVRGGGRDDGRLEQGVSDGSSDVRPGVAADTRRDGGDRAAAGDEPVLDGPRRRAPRGNTVHRRDGLGSSGRELLPVSCGREAASTSKAR